MANTLGQTIQELRKKNNMTQMELAEKMCITDKAISKWERDVSTPDVIQITNLANIFNVDVKELLNSKTNENKTKTHDLINQILSSITIAMGIAVFILITINLINIKDAILLLSIGLITTGFYMIKK